MAAPLASRRTRWWLALLPPAGLYVLWRSSRGLAMKLAGTVVLLLITGLYAAGVVILLLRTTPLEIEWRGGYLPALTYRKTAPDFDRLERDRLAPRPARAPSPPAQSGYWTAFRGPAGDGVYREGPIATNWPTAGLQPLWKQPVGGGYSSFAVAQGLAFTLEQRRETEAAVAYQLSDGAEAWAYEWPARFTEYYSEDGPRSTPLYADGAVFALGAQGDLHCLSADRGLPVWSRNLVKETGAGVPSFGFAASPIRVGSNIVVVTSARNGKSIMSFRGADGEVVWSALDDPMGYATPVLCALAGREQLVVCGETRTLGLDPGNGEVLWEFPWRVQHGQSPIAQPVILGTNRFLLSAGYFTGCVAVEVQRDASGFTARALWQSKQLKNKFSSSVYHEGFVYGLDEDILTCLDAETGERKWKQGRYGYGQLLLAGDHLVILSGKGELALAQASPSGHLPVARFPAIAGKTWNVPALDGGKLLVRNSAEMACFSVVP